MTKQNPEPQLPDNSVDWLRHAIAKSIADVVLHTNDDVKAWLRTATNGILRDVIYDRVKAVLSATTETGFDTHDLRSVAGALQLRQSIEGTVPGYADIVSVIAAGLPAGTPLKTPDNPVWIEAATLGRSLIVLNTYQQPDQRHLGVASAAKRLQARGFEIKLGDLGVDPSSPGLEAATSEISNRFARLGLYDSLAALNSTIARTENYAFDQYLFGRRYGLRENAPSIPFGFLFNLAVKTPDYAPTSQDPDADWDEALRLACDVVAAVNVQPYDRFWMINASPKRMGRLLEEIGLHDHLFGLRQWSASLTPSLLRDFFGTSYDSEIFATVGWTINDAACFAEALAQAVRPGPVRIPRADLLATGLDSTTLDSLLQSFVHPTDRCNHAYTSPLAARDADLMFRPLIAGMNDTIVAPTSSFVGPACYEVVAAAARAALPAQQVAELIGSGTERSVAALLRRQGLIPSFEAAKYNEGKSIDAGECDLVLENDNDILLIECKGKPLTRATMAADPGAALLDYAGGVIAAQVQALQHERILRDKGEILFDDGRCLSLKSRRVTRLSLTLLDHGSLQDRFLFVSLVTPLLRSQITYDPNGSKKKRYEEVNRELDRHRTEMKAAERWSSSAWNEALGAVTLSFGQFAALLSEVSDLAKLLDYLRKPATFATMNPLLEYEYLRQQGLLGD